MKLNHAAKGTAEQMVSLVNTTKYLGNKWCQSIFLQRLEKEESLSNLLWGHNNLDYLGKHHEKRKLWANLTHEHGYQNPKQIMSKQNPKMYLKIYHTKLSLFKKSKAGLTYKKKNKIQQMVME